MMRRVAIILVASALVCASLLCGCGSKSGTGTSSEASPGEVVGDFYRSLLNGDYTGAYDMLSNAAKGKISYEEFEKGMIESSREAPVDKNTQVEIVSEEVNGDTATVRASLQGSEGDIKMVRENGAWRIDF